MKPGSSLNRTPRTDELTADWGSRKSELATQLITGLYREGLFKTWLRDKPAGWELVSGLWSPFYVSVRDIPARPRLFRLAVKATCELIANEAPNANRIVGLAAAGVPIAAAAAYVSGLSMAYTRKLSGVRSLEDLERHTKAYGGHSLVEGDFNDGDRVILFDDVVSRFDSKATAMRQLQMELARRGVQGVEVEAVLVLLDRGRHGVREAQRAGVQLSSLIALGTGAIEMLRGTADDVAIDTIQRYVDNEELFQNRSLQAELEQLAASHPS